MKTSKFFFSRLLIPMLAFGMIFTASSCDKDDDDDMDKNPSMKMSTYMYDFNNGQVASSPYEGSHPDNLMAEMMVEEMANGGSKITVTLENTVDGQMYPVHAHDAADPSTTPNGTPYNETPNSDVFTKMIEGNGGTASISQETNMSYSELTGSYEGFFVVHDPMQAVNTADISTYLVVGSFAREQNETNFSKMSYSYDFNTGQLAQAFAYSGTHSDDLSAMISVQELATGNSRVQVHIMNTMNGEMYATHAHDKADPATTPNGTPYDESPNGDVLVQMIEGNGGTAYGGQLSTMSYTELTTTYEAFFVIHDPLQAINTADPTTYIVLGNFARK